MPYHDALDDALEFEVLVARSVRRGRLDVRDFVDGFALLAQRMQLDVALPHALGLVSLTEAVGRLPPSWAQHKAVWVVASLADFSLTSPEPWACFPCASLDDDTLLVACHDGLGGVQGLVMAFCTVLHEGAKWRRLCAAADAQNISPDDASPSVHAALIAGVSVEAWQRADAAVHGQLRAQLMQTDAPTLVVHAGLHPDTQAAEAKRAAPRILATLTEMGLGSRPVHLWVGPNVLVDTLSPYARDLGPQLLSWAQQAHAPDVRESRDASGAPAQTDAPGAVYTALHAFLRSNPNLAGEMHTAERTVGVHRMTTGATAFDVIDVGRLEASLCDPALITLPQAQTPRPAPIIVRLDPPMHGITAPVCERLVQGLGAQLISITVVTDGAWSWAAPQPIAEICTHLPWHGGAGVTHRTQRPPLHDRLHQAQLSVSPVDTFVDISVPQRSCPAAIAAHLGAEAQGVTFGQMPLAYALGRGLMLRHTSFPEPEVHWLVVTPHRQAQNPHAALCCALLNHLLAPPEGVAPTPQSPQKPVKRGGVRLRV